MSFFKLGDEEIEFVSMYLNMPNDFQQQFDKFVLMASLIDDISVTIKRENLTTIRVYFSKGFINEPTTTHMIVTFRHNMYKQFIGMSCLHNGTTFSDRKMKAGMNLYEQLEFIEEYFKEHLLNEGV